MWQIIAAALLCAGTTLASGVTDSLDLGDEASSSVHKLSAVGDVKAQRVGDRVGGNEMTRVCRVIGGGAAVSFEVAQRAGEMALEIEELFGRTRGVGAYRVSVDRRAVAFRTFRGAGAGSVHRFIRYSADGERATIRIENVGEAALAIGRVWAWSDLDAHVRDGGMEVPFFLAPTIGLSFRNQEKDLAELAKIKQSMGERAHVRPAFTAWIAYAALDEAEARRRIDYVLEMAEKSGLLVQVCFDSWWANTPSGPDGKGGRWTDPKYQQVVWNASERRYQLSVPNQWSNTPWLSVNHPDLNAHKASRLRAAAKYLGERSAAGARPLILSVNLDNEPVYWASGNAGLGSDLLQADFNPATVAAAAKDGVKLDPADGLSFEERRWLLNNLLNYNAMIGRATKEGLLEGERWQMATGVEGRARSSLPTDNWQLATPLFDNIYTQAMVGFPELQYPMLDRAYPFWESAAPREVRCGGEWNGQTLAEREAVERMISLGRNAAINAECGNDARETHGIRLAYALGQRYYTPYNYPLDKMDVAAQAVGDVDAAFPPFEHQRVLLEHDFARDDWRKVVASHENLQVGLIGNTVATAVYPVASNRVGSVTYRVISPGEAFDGLAMEMLGRACDFGKRGRKDVCLKVLAGAAEPSLREMASFSDTGSISENQRVDLSAVARGQKRVVVRVELHAPAIPESVLSWVGFWHVRFTSPWGAPAKGGVKEVVPTAGQSRTQSLLVSWRRDAEIAMEEAGKQAPAEAREAYERGEYAKSYAAARR